MREQQYKSVQIGHVKQNKISRRSPFNNAEKEMLKSHQEQITSIRGLTAENY